MKKITCTFLVGLASLAFTHTAAADLVVIGTVNDTGFGFGNQPRALTIQEQGMGDDRESGCVGISGGSLVIGPSGCLPSAGDVFMGNTVRNLGGDEAEPHDDNQKFGAPTIGSLGFVAANEIVIGFDAAEPGSGSGMNGLTIEDLTLKFYNGDEVVLAIDGEVVFLQTFTGVGRPDYYFGIDEEQQEQVNNLIFSAANFGDYRLALESTIADAQGGPESFFFARRPGGLPVSEPASLGLLGLGIAGLGLARRRR